MRPAQSLMFGVRLAEAQALLYGRNDGPARDAQVERWLADVERGFQFPPQLSLPLPTSRGTRPAPPDRPTTLCEQGQQHAAPVDGSSLGTPHAGKWTRTSRVDSGGGDN
jgi:hypothetical protein